jgi:septin 2
MKALHHKVNIVPIIAKADTLTLNEVKSLKQKVMQYFSLHQSEAWW